MSFTSLALLISFLATAPADKPWYARVDSTLATSDLRSEAGAPDYAFSKKFPTPLGRGTALEILMNTRMFTSTAVGYGGETPIQCYAFKAVLKQPDAADAFAELIRRGQPAGQMFGLCGLYLTDRKRFDAEVKSYRASDLKVETFIGCTRSVTLARRLVAEIESGEWPGWLKSVPDQPPPEEDKQGETGARERIR